MESTNFINSQVLSSTHALQSCAFGFIKFVAPWCMGITIIYTVTALVKVN